MFLAKTSMLARIRFTKVDFLFASTAFVTFFALANKFVEAIFATSTV
jgi:hypothetical protein